MTAMTEHYSKGAPEPSCKDCGDAGWVDGVMTVPLPSGKTGDIPCWVVCKACGAKVAMEKFFSCN